MTAFSALVALAALESGQSDQSKTCYFADDFTLERMALEIARNAHGILGGRMEQIIVRVQKPSVLSFARNSGVEITRKVTDF